jgi:hypothetical protein
LLLELDLEPESEPGTVRGSKTNSEGVEPSSRVDEPGMGRWRTVKPGPRSESELDSAG